MDFTNFWFDEGPGGSGDPGDPIGQSLRFRAQSYSSGSYLHRTGWADSGNVWTFSCWVKGWLPWTSTVAQQNATIFSWFTNGGNQTVDELNIFGNFPSNGRNEIMQYMEGSLGGNEVSNQEFNDPSAWYHIVWKSVSVSDVTIWVNGVQVTDWRASSAPFTSQNYINKNCTCSIGARAPGNLSPQNTQYNCQGHMADVYFIDGQALEPTSFGRYNEDDVWVPTLPNFTMGQSRYSDFLYTAPDSGQTYGTLGKNFHASFPASGAFDGELTQNAGIGMAGTASGGVWLVYRPPTPIEVTKVEVWTRNYQVGGSGGGKYSVNSGNSQPLPTFSADFEWFDIGLSGTLTSFGVQDNTNSVTYIGGIRITTTEGTEILIDPYLWSAGMFQDSSDTPNWNSTTPAVGADGAFDGVPSSFTKAIDGNMLIWRLEGGVSNVTLLEVYTTFASDRLFLNESEVASGVTDGWVTLYSGAATTVNSIGSYNDGQGTGHGFGAIRINGQILVDGVNNSYGPNGFHLDFADPNDLGADRSGNGNDFTATGFDTDAPISWDSLVDWPETAGSPPHYVSNIFNGGTGTNTEADQCFFRTNNSQLTIDLLPLLSEIQGPITKVNAFVYPSVSGPGITLECNGSTSTVSGNAWQDVTVTHDGSPVTSFTISNAPTSGLAIICIRVNDVMLVNNMGEDYDLMLDSPTQNFSTYNPLLMAFQQRGGSNTYISTPTRDGNLKVESNGQSFGTGNIGLSSGKWYYETNVGFGDGSVVICPSPWPASTSTLYYLIEPQYGYTNSGNGRTFGPGWTDHITTGLTQYKEGDVVGCAIDFDNGRIFYSVNGVWENGADPVAGTNAPIEVTLNDREWTIGALSGQASPKYAALNFGQQDGFRYPAPEGYLSLQTQNLPEAMIRNGREHFRAITGPGSGGGSTDPDAILGAFSSTWSASGDGFGTRPPANAFDDDTTNFLNNSAGGQTITWDTSSFNLVGELTVRQQGSGGFYRMLIDGVEAIASIPDASEPSNWTVTVNNPQSIVWDPSPGNGSGVNIYNFQLNGNNLRDGNILAVAQQTFPNGLWWIKDRANTNQNQLVDSVRGGTVASTCPQSTKNTTYAAPAGDSVAWCWNSADPTISGFNIIEFTGDANSTQDVAHGLPGTPEFVISASQGAAPGGFETFHVGCAAGQSVTIDAPRAQNTSSRYSGVDGTNITYGGDYNTNGQQMIAYAWTSIPGYSAFGSYTGNGNADGPFVYTGFRPAFVLIKNIGISNNWYIGDTTRNPNNNSMLVLATNSQQAENSASNNFDILSNGFKLRTSDSATNGTQTLVYAAFAENPFSSPVTAR